MQGGHPTRRRVRHLGSMLLALVLLVPLVLIGPQGANGYHAAVSAELRALATTAPQQQVQLLIQANPDQLAQARAQARRYGATIGHELSIINTFVAQLPAQAALELAAQSSISSIWLDAEVRSSADPQASEETYTSPYILYPAAASGVNKLHQQTLDTPRPLCSQTGIETITQPDVRPIQGMGVMVAVIDSGMMPMSSSGNWRFYDEQTGTLYASDNDRCLLYRDFLPRSTANGNDGDAARNSVDQYGHGTHVLATIADNRRVIIEEGGRETPAGVAPQVHLMVARALDAQGVGTYSSVIAAIDWVVAHKDAFNVRVLNLSLYTPLSGPYWADPLNQAVMRAWQAGIVVVVPAGNAGPGAGTITAPGNVPYVITVGAIKSGRYNTSGRDELAFYSSRGPTESGFVKPDVLIPASQTIAPMPSDATLAQTMAAGRLHEYGDLNLGLGSFRSAHYYRLSGTSMAAAQISGIVALMLQVSPHLTNDQIKYRLMSTARPAIDSATGAPAYSIWEQGAGLVDAAAAVKSSSLETANAGMDIATDLDTTSATQTHYWGHTSWDEQAGVYRLIDPQTGDELNVWDGTSQAWSGANQIWSGANQIWSGANQIWSGANQIWSGGLSQWTDERSMWAGANQIWSGSRPPADLNAASHSELAADE